MTCPRCGLETPIEGNRRPEVLVCPLGHAFSPTQALPDTPPEYPDEKEPWQQ